MYVKPTTQQLVALADLSRMPGWEHVKGFLVAETQDTLSRMLDVIDPVDLHKMRGRGKLLRELVAQVDEAQAQLEKIRR